MEEITPVLQSFYSDFHKLSMALQKIAVETERNDISQYPIFVASSLPTKLGVLLFMPEKLDLRWYFSISFAEELVKKGVIDKSRFEAFKITYKSPEQYACVLLMLPEEASFIFVPYQNLS